MEEKMEMDGRRWRVRVREQEESESSIGSTGTAASYL